MNLKNLLITLTSIAVVLGLITFYVVFYANTGTYVVNSDTSTNNVFSSSTANLASSTASSTSSLASSSASSSIGTAAGQFTSNYSTPPITWTQGNEAMSVTNATLSGTQLTLELQIIMGSVAECVPLNLKLVADEKGTLAPPVTTQFTFPDSGTCAGTPGETYSDQQVIFSVDPSALPLILTTGGTPNTLLEINTTSTNGLIIELPPSAG